MSYLDELLAGYGAGLASRPTRPGVTDCDVLRAHGDPWQRGKLLARVAWAFADVAQYHDSGDAQPALTGLPKSA